MLIAITLPFADAVLDASPRMVQFAGPGDRKAEEIVSACDHGAMRRYVVNALRWAFRFGIAAADPEDPRLTGPNHQRVLLPHDWTRSGQRDTQRRARRLLFVRFAVETRRNLRALPQRLLRAVRYESSAEVAR